MDTELSCKEGLHIQATHGSSASADGGLDFPRLLDCSDEDKSNSCQPSTSSDVYPM